MSIDRLQADFAMALRDAGAEPSSIAELDMRDPRCAARFGLYRGNVHAAWEKALAHAYPVVRALVGAEFFAELARAYGRLHPSANGDLNQFGARFCAFLSTYEPVQSLAYLPDTAALEWLAHRAHYAADAPGFARERMAVVSPRDLLAARFTLHPACFWMPSRFPIVTIWRAHQARPDADLPGSPTCAECALVTRSHWRVEVVASSPAEIAALTQLLAGRAMDDAIGAAFDVDAKFDFAKTLVRWLDLAVLVDIR